MGQTAYSASKAALIGAAKTMSAEIYKQGIRVNVLAPGPVDTEMWRQVPEKRRSEILETVSLGRPATAREIANVLLFLVSDEAYNVTGQVIRVDGGENGTEQF